jgi:hypothetical protein
MYAVEMASCGMTYLSSFIKIGLAIQKLIRGIHMKTHRRTDTHTAGDLTSLPILFQKK